MCTDVHLCLISSVSTLGLSVVRSLRYFNRCIKCELRFQHVVFSRMHLPHNAISFSFFSKGPNLTRYCLEEVAIASVKENSTRRFFKRCKEMVDKTV